MSNEFQELINQFLRVYASFHPDEAFSSGWREFAGQIRLITESELQSYVQFLKNISHDLSKIDPKSLSKEEYLDYLIFQNKIDSDLFEILYEQKYTHNPYAYTFAASIFDYLLKNYAPLQQRLEEMCKHLDQLPDFYYHAAQTLQMDTLAPELVEITSIMLKGMIAFLTNIENEVKSLETEDEKISSETYHMVKTSSSTAVEALSLFVKKLEELPPSKTSFRLGKDLYLRMLASKERVSLPLDELLKAAEADLERNTKEFNLAATNIDPNKTPEEIIKEIKKDHPTKETLISDTQAMLTDIKKYILEKKFVSIPSEVMPKVMITPKPFRAYAFAAMNSPGPLEKKATESYYYITPPEDDWAPQEQEDWLQTFNYRGLIDISVHEAFPGHYLHHLHNQRSKSLMSKLFGAYHFWEGYALYVEEAMWQSGFHAGDYKYRMAQLLETLLRDVRFIVSVKLHTTTDFTVEDGIQMFMKYVHMGRKPAESEAKRGTYDPGYLNYCLGKLMIDKLRKVYEVEHKDTFSLLEFHDTLLSFGAPPIPILRQFMLKDTKVIPKIL